MKNALFYLGLALLFTHELDAMPNHEWRVLPILHYLFSGHSAYEFSSALSTILIFGAAVCGAGYFVAARFERRAKAG